MLYYPPLLAEMIFLLILSFAGTLYHPYSAQIWVYTSVWCETVWAHCYRNELRYKWHVSHNDQSVEWLSLTLHCLLFCFPSSHTWFCPEKPSQFQKVKKKKNPKGVWFSALRPGIKNHWQTLKCWHQSSFLKFLKTVMIKKSVFYTFIKNIAQSFLYHYLSMAQQASLSLPLLFSFKKLKPKCIAFLPCN